LTDNRQLVLKARTHWKRSGNGSGGLVTRSWLTAVMVLIPALLPANEPGSTQKDPNETKKKVRFVWNNRPSLRFGDWLRVDLRVKFHADFRGFSPEIETDEGTFDFQRKRIGIEGTFLRHFEYEVERELRESNPWRDVFVNFRYFRDFQVRAGKFKIPFGLDRLTSVARLDFVYRSRIGDTLAPGRDIGVAVHGRFFRRGLAYETGFFRQDGEDARSGESLGAGNTFAGRVTGTPLRLLKIPEAIENLELGVAFTTSTVPEGLNSVRARTVSGETFFPSIFVNGNRLRLGLEQNWSHGPFSIKGEFMHLQDERHNQGLFGQDLPDLISRGWYVSGTWTVTGERKIEDMEPRKNFLRGGIGAVEMAGRYEQLRYGSSEHPGPPLRNPRAPNILGNSDRVWTVGANWYLNRWAKIQANAIREKIEDTLRSPIPGRDLFWMWVCRLQFAF
jgi:phosphate-selective porin OprO and OprP